MSGSGPITIDSIVVAVEELVKEELLVRGGSIPHDVRTGQRSIRASHLASLPLALTYSTTVSRACAHVSVDLGALKTVLKGHPPSSQ